MEVRFTPEHGPGYGRESIRTYDTGILAIAGSANYRSREDAVSVLAVYRTRGRGLPPLRVRARAYCPAAGPIPLWPHRR